MTQQWAWVDNVCSAVSRSTVIIVCINTVYEDHNDHVFLYWAHVSGPSYVGILAIPP